MRTLNGCNLPCENNVMHSLHAYFGSTKAFCLHPFIVLIVQNGWFWEWVQNVSKKIEMGIWGIPAYSCDLQTFDVNPKCITRIAVEGIKLNPNCSSREILFSWIKTSSRISHMQTSGKWKVKANILAVLIYWKVKPIYQLVLSGQWVFFILCRDIGIGGHEYEIVNNGGSLHRFHNELWQWWRYSSSHNKLP